MTQKEVQDALISHLATQLSGYANLLVTYSGEAALAAFKKYRPTILVIPESGDRVSFPAEDKWTFLVDATMSQQEFAQASPIAAQNADRGLVEDLREAINSDANYATLTAAGLYHSFIRSLKADEGNVEMVNPHLFSCSTYN